MSRYITVADLGLGATSAIIGGIGSLATAGVSVWQTMEAQKRFDDQIKESKKRRKHEAELMQLQMQMQQQNIASGLYQEQARGQQIASIAKWGAIAAIALAGVYLVTKRRK